MTVIVPSSYPVQGIFYMLAHPSLFRNLICPIFITILWGIAVFIFGFAYLLKLQAHALIDVKCPAAVAWIVCIIFVLLEVAVLSLLFYLIVLPIYEDSLFDRTLKLRGLRHVLKQNEGNDMVKCMRGVGGGLWILLFQIAVLILSFPVNLIPILGQVIFIAINGWVLTFGYRFHYDAEIRNITILQSRREAWARKSEYSQFGSAAFGLQMVPLANLLFAWTNVVGCALWVADEIERDEACLQSEQSSHSLIGPNSQAGTPPPAPNQPGNQYPPQQFQQNHQQYSMKQQSLPPQGPPGNPYSQQGSVRIPPKDKKQTGLEY
ncbi:hypothetical protein BGZ97_012486 [Linnemannia gamsii]|uniref:Uncharacterized protein n=1 Tax=Linnemannia gamsii TaxID=64522 RepID=A0A9P6R3W5_9FUNG|nr:hypothetical protein BGZ97_012486 [Linnemannia gamsii]